MTYVTDNGVYKKDILAYNKTVKIKHRGHFLYRPHKGRKPPKSSYALPV